MAGLRPNVLCGSLTLLWRGVVLAASLPLGDGQQQGQNKRSFTAAVYEHRVFNQEFPHVRLKRVEALNWINRNLDVYENQAKIAAQKGAVIIVFPENGILGYDKTRESVENYLEHIPDPKKSTVIPCVDPKYGRDTEILKRLSCVAQENRIYIVANMGEKRGCKPASDSLCPTDERYQFDTNVIFDSTGKLVARYRKYYLYWQRMFDSPAKPEVAIVDTPFGKLGTFVAGDIYYKSPAIDLVEKYQVDTIVMTTTWDNTFPYPHAIEVQHGFALRMRVNLLAANTQAHKYKIGGSGIYSASGAIAYRYNTITDEGALLVGELPIGPRTETQPPVPPWVEDNHEVKDTPFTTLISGDLLNSVLLSHISGRVRVCQHKLCCTLSYSFKRQDQNEMFIFGVFDGLHTELISMYTQVCGLIKCYNNTPQGCGKAPRTSTSIMGEFRMWGNFTDSVYVFPYVAARGHDGTDLSEGQFHYGNNVIHSVNGLTNPVLSVILFGRHYGRDKVKETKPPYNTVPPVKNNTNAVIPVFVTASTSAILFMFIVTIRLVIQKS